MSIKIESKVIVKPLKVVEVHDGEYLRTVEVEIVYRDIFGNATKDTVEIPRKWVKEKRAKVLEHSFTINEIEKMAGGAILEREGVCYCLSNGVMMYCKDLDQDIWHAFNGIEIN